MVKQLQGPDGKAGSKGQQTRHWAVFDGVLHRTTEAADANEGYDSARPFVPESLRPTVLQNFHNSIWGGFARVWLAITELPCATKMAQRETIIQSRYMREKQQATRAYDTHAPAGLAYVCLVVVQRNGQKESDERHCHCFSLQRQMSV